MEIRKMNFEDFEKIKDNLKEEFDDFWNPSILKSELESSNSYYIVAKENDLIYGFAGLLITPDDVEITNIVVRKTERKKGVGKLLLDELINIAKEKGKSLISLEVNEKNIPAISLYKSFDFKEVGLRKKYYNGIDNAIIMNKNL